MNKIDELLMNEEVEWKKLGDVCEIKTGDIISKNFISKNKGQYPVINSGKDPLGYVNIWNTENDPIGITTRGAGVGSITYQEGKYYRGNLNYSVTIKKQNEIKQRFLYHLLIQMQKEIHQLCTFNGIPALNASELKKLIIPIPSIETQEKIVKTLDKFTNYVTELQAELQARTKQYEYYRDFLLSEEYLNKLSEQIYDFTKEKYELKITTLGDIAKVNRGASPRPISKYITDDDTGVPWIKIGDIGLNSKYVTKTKQKITVEGAKNSRVLNKGDFIMSNSMSYVRPYILDIVGAIHDGWASINDFDKFLDSDFLYYYLTTTKVQNYWNSKINSSSVSNLNSEIIRSLPIPLVDKRLQKNIVIILDKFQLLLSDTKGLLPKEIEQRQKQYEYYREKLLTFDVECGSKQASKQASKS